MGTNYSKLEGYKIKTYDNGNYYEGQLNDKGEPHGKGKMHYVSDISAIKSWYKGSWSNGLRHGHGTKLYKSGKKYKGSWVSDIRHGYGKLFVPKRDNHNSIIPHKYNMQKGEWFEDNYVSKNKTN